MKYYMIDAFTDELFKGNPAGVCLLEKELPDSVMQKIAFENNLAETAFLLKKDSTYYLRWFTPEFEIDLCGHATLATAFVVMNYVEPSLNQVEFETKSGRLSVVRNEDLYMMNFPSRMPAPIQMDQTLIEKALGCRVLEIHSSRDLVLLVKDEETVEKLKVNKILLSSINPDVSFGVIVTAKGESCDFVSRFFTPNAGSDEDPVTGSAHSSLIPFWSQRLNKTQMVAKQLSKRSGVLMCEDRGERVTISGKAICYLEGNIRLN